VKLMGMGAYISAMAGVGRNWELALMEGGWRRSEASAVAGRGRAGRTEEGRK
jgi:hypothetical protein